MKNTSNSDPVPINGYKGFSGSGLTQDLKVGPGQTYGQDIPQRYRSFCPDPMHVLGVAPVSTKFTLVAAAGNTWHMDGSPGKCYADSLTFIKLLNPRDFAEEALRFNSQNRPLGDLPITYKFPAVEIQQTVSENAYAQTLKPYGIAWCVDTGVAMTHGRGSIAYVNRALSCAMSTGLGSLAICVDRSMAVVNAPGSLAHADGMYSMAIAAQYDCAAAATDMRSIALADKNSRAKAGRGSAIVLIRRDADDNITHIKAALVGECGIEPDTYYTLDAKGKIVEVPDA